MPASTRRKKPTSRKRSHKNNKISRRLIKYTKILFLSFFAVVAAGAVLTFFSFYKFIKTPFAEGHIEKKAALSIEEPFTLSVIVLADKKDPSSRIEGLYNVLIDPKNSKLHVIEIAPELEVGYPMSMGQGIVDKVYALGELVGGGEGAKLTNALVSKIVAKRVDRYILTDVEHVEEFRKLIGVDSFSDFSTINLVKSASTLTEIFQVLRSGFESDLSSGELISLAMLAKELSSKDTEVVRVSQSDIQNPGRLDEQTTSIFVNSRILEEGLRVLVLNGSEVPGLGALASRFVNNLGGSVVSVGNTPASVEKSIIIVNSEKVPFTAEKIAGEIGIGRLVRLTELRDFVEDRAKNVDITIMIGVDYPGLL